MSGIGNVGGGYHNPINAYGGAAAGAGAAGAAAAVEVRLGARGEAVTAIQSELLAGGYDVGAADGVFGRGTERAVADLQRRAGLPATGCVDAATRASIASRAGPRITASVGPGGRNDPVDVRAVQRKLGALGYYAGTADGLCGPKLQAAIRLFDAVVRAVPELERGSAELASARRLDPGELAEQWLRAPNAPAWTRMPRSGTGFSNIDIERHDYGTSWLADTIRDAGARYETSYRATARAPLMLTNDASLRAGGDTRDHETHETGLDLDVRPARRSGNGPLNYRQPAYDREATWAQIKAFLDSPNVEQVIYNDPEILARAEADARYRGRIATDAAGVHDNHFHVDLRPPAIVDR